MIRRSGWIFGIGLIIAAGVFAAATIAPAHSHAATSCNYGCCSNSDCGTGQACYNPGTEVAYCATPAICTTSANCGTGYSCLNGSCVITTSSNTNSNTTNPSNPSSPSSPSTPSSPTSAGSSCNYACCGNAGYQGSGGCQLAEANNPDTVCYYPSTVAAYCGNPLPAGQTLSTGCAFPTSSSAYNEAGWNAIDAQCAVDFSATAATCTGNHNCSASSYTDPAAAELCGEPGAFPAAGYCIGTETPQANGCVYSPSESEVADVVGASCTTGPVATAPTAPSTPTGPTSSTNPPVSIPGPLDGPGISSINQALKNFFSNLGTNSPGTAGSPGPTTTSAPELLINGLRINSYAVGAPWTLTYTSDMPNTTFTICATINGAQTCTPNWGTTDANGSWTQSGTFSSADIGSWVEWLEFPSGGASDDIIFTVGEGAGSAGANTNITFPATILVTASSLNVRSEPNTSAPLAGSQTLYAGDTFTATNEVVGENVTENGVTSDLWWFSSLGNYVWSGGTQTEAGGTQPGAGSKAVVTNNAQAQASNPSISSVWYTAVTGLLGINGTFDASGNTVYVNGTALSNNGADQTASSLQIPIDQSNNGSVYNSVLSGTYTVSVKDSEGTANFAVSPTTSQAGTPVISSVQGYNPTTKVYETTNNVLNPGDTYIILYGTFASSGNGVTLGFGATAATVPASQIAYDSATQINVSLGSLIPAGASSFTAIVYNFGGPGPSQPVKVAVNGNGSVSTQTMSVSIPTVLAQLHTASSLTAALNIAGSAGLTIAGGVTDQYGDVSYLVTTPNGNFVAAIGDYDASTAVGAPISDAYVYNNTADASSDEFLCKANVGSGTADVNSFPDGKVYGLADATNYSVSVNNTSCGTGCSVTQSAATAAANTITAAGGPPLVSNSSVATINIAWISNTIDNDSLVLAQSIPIVLADGTSVCNIQLSSPSLWPEYEDQVAKGNTGFLQQVITHEMGHCMGLSHASTPNSVMYYDATAQPSNASFTSDDKAVLASLRSDANIPVTCASAKLLGWSCVDPMQILSQNQTTNVYSCQSCPAGQVPIAGATGDVSCQTCPTGNFYQEVSANTDGSLTIENKCNSYCTAASGYPNSLYNILGSQCVQSCGANQVPSENGHQCECAPGMTYDVGSGQCVENGQSGGLLSPAGDCDSGFLAPNGQCYAFPEGTATSNLCFTLSDGSTQCSCADGYQQVGSSCVQVDTSAPSDDDAYPQYACESSFCTYIGEGPDYSDPTCGGGCNSD